MWRRVDWLVLLRAFYRCIGIQRKLFLIGKWLSIFFELLLPFGSFSFKINWCSLFFFVNHFIGQLNFRRISYYFFIGDFEFSPTFRFILLASTFKLVLLYIFRLFVIFCQFCRSLWLVARVFTTRASSTRSFNSQIDRTMFTLTWISINCLLLIAAFSRPWPRLWFLFTLLIFDSVKHLVSRHTLLGRP